MEATRSRQHGIHKRVAAVHCGRAADASKREETARTCQNAASRVSPLTLVAQVNVWRATDNSYVDQILGPCFGRKLPMRYERLRLERLHKQRNRADVSTTK